MSGKDPYGKRSWNAVGVEVAQFTERMVRNERARQDGRSRELSNTTCSGRDIRKSNNVKKVRQRCRGIKSSVAPGQAPAQTRKLKECRRAVPPCS